jgi:hypothetical protein
LMILNVGIAIKILFVHIYNRYYEICLLLAVIDDELGIVDDALLDKLHDIYDEYIMNSQ